jgi:flagellar hook-associated protein 3 FlgL
MRVTHAMIKDTMLRGVTRNMARLEELEEQITTGQRVSRPSEDPVAAAAILRLDSSAAETSQFLRNIDDARSWLDITDQALTGVEDSIQRAREISLAAPNGTVSAEGRDAIARELDSLIKQVVSLGNRQYAGQYIFAGQMTRTAAFDESTSPPTYQGDANSVARVIDAGVTIAVNVTGDMAIQPTLDALTQIRDAVSANDTNGMRAGIAALDDAQTRLLAAQSEIGARSNRIDAQRERLLDFQVSLARLRSETQDVDMAQALSEYAVQDTVYKASLQAGARAIQPSLIDYLR